MGGVKESIRLNLIDLINRKGCKKSELARACKVSPASVTGWVKSGTIDIERIPDICDFFGITVSEFFCRAEQLEPPTQLSRDEKEIVELTRLIPDAGKHALLVGLRDYVLSQPDTKITTS